MKTDLHIHTTASDGSMTPTEVVRWAKKTGIELMAVTDHDTVDGVDEAKAECAKLNLQFIPGIELSTFSTCEIHMLGYNFDYKDKDFIARLNEIKDMRKNRNVAMGERLKALNINLDIDFEAKGLGRMIMAREMVKKNYCKDINHAFEQYLGPHGKAYVATKRITPLDAVKLVKQFHGYSCIAHPKKLLQEGRLEILIAGLKPYGLNGIELNYPSHNDQDRKALQTLIKRYHLLETGGSDFHGDEDKDFRYDIDKRTYDIIRKAPRR